MKEIDPAFQIVSPCPRRWSEMAGTDRRRFCESCQLHVHNLSAMTLAERDDFKGQLTEPACITYELLPDGTMAEPRRFEMLRKWLRLAAAAAAVVVPFFGLGCAAPAVMPTGGMRKPPGNDGKEAKCAPERRRLNVLGAIVDRRGSGDR